MVKKSNEELLQELIKKQTAIKNRIAALESRKRTKDDKKLTRKKILIGAYILQKYKDDHAAFIQLNNDFDRFLTRQNDRKLFELPLHE